jgi:hypothetical protein
MIKNRINKKTEDRRQKTEDRRQETEESGLLTNGYRLVFYSIFNINNMRTRNGLRVLVWVMVLVPLLKSNCQTTAVGARSVSLAGISAGLEDAWAVVNNPAGLARYEHFSIATSFEERFLMKELGYYGLAVPVPVSKGCLGISLLFSGYHSFIDQKVNLAYGRLFGENIMSGLCITYIFQDAGGEAKPVHQVSYDLGTIVILSKKVKLAFSTFNPFQLYYKSEDYATLPAIFKLGLSYHYSSSFIIHTELEKDLDYPPSLKIGMEYNFSEIFIIRGGIRGFPLAYSFGAAVIHKHFLFEFSSCYHQYLGFTPQVSFQFDFK